MAGLRGRSKDLDSGSCLRSSRSRRETAWELAARQARRAPALA